MKKELEFLNDIIDLVLNNVSKKELIEALGDRKDRINNMSKTHLYCIEVSRGGVGEEDMVLHHEFKKEPTRGDVLTFIEEEDVGYDDLYCRFTYYEIKN